MSSSRKLKGYIFRKHDGNYYLEYMKGSTPFKLDAKVFSKEEIERRIDGTWGHKLQGKWLMIYHAS